MTNRTDNSDNDDQVDTSPIPSPGSGRPGIPRWVKVSGLVVAAVILLLVVLALTGVLGGQHGPGRHMPGSNNPGGHTPPVQHGP
jgi:hypothetical protein